MSRATRILLLVALGVTTSNFSCQLLLPATPNWWLAIDRTFFQLCALLLAGVFMAIEAWADRVEERQRLQRQVDRVKVDPVMRPDQPLWKMVDAGELNAALIAAAKRGPPDWEAKR